MIEIKDLSFYRRDRALLDKVCLSVKKGELVLVTGDNGSGKTTFLKILSQLLLPDSGALYWSGKAIEDDKEDYLEALLYIGHLNGIADDLSPIENLQAWAMLRHRQPKLDFLEGLARVGLLGYERKACRQLSAGQKRRVALARLQCLESELWILDEPMSALDAHGQRMICQWLETYLQLGGIAIVATHGLSDIGVQVTHEIILKN